MQVIKIGKVFMSRVETIDGKLTYVFNCMVATNGINRMCEIWYDLGAIKWILSKM
jgi:hypothetical protein